MTEPKTQTTKPKNWKWYFSDDEERYLEGGSTREETIAEGRSNYEGTFYIMEATKGKFDFHIDDYRYFEQLDCQNEEQLDPDGDGLAAHLTKEQGIDLVKTINDAIDSWLERNTINLESWGFDETRNREEINP